MNGLRTANARRLGVRSRTVLGATAALAVALLAGASVLRIQLRDSLYTSISNQTLTRALGVAALVKTGDFSGVVDSEGLKPQWVQVVNSDGHVVAFTTNVRRLTKPFANIPSGGKTTVQRLSGLPIDTGEAVAVAFVHLTGDGQQFTVLAASPLDLADVTDRNVVKVLLLVFPALLLIAAAVLWLVVRRAMRPVEAIRTKVASITSTDLRGRVPHPGTNDEIGRLATTMNDMLDRLHTSSLRQQRFVGDASHELRSPLASLRNQLEVSTLDNTDPGWNETVTGMIADHERLERLIRDLLLLARHDDHELVNAEPVDIGYLVRSEMNRRPPVAGLTRRVHAENVLVNGNADELVRVLRNLVDNAERHATANITVSVHRATGSTSFTGTNETNGRNGFMVEMVVEDDGPGIPDPFRSVIFERFRRLDDARAAEAGGSGLGLAIVADLVHAHGGTVAVAPSAVGARFVVRLPALRSDEAE